MVSKLYGVNATIRIFVFVCRMFFLHQKPRSSKEITDNRRNILSPQPRNHHTSIQDQIKITMNSPISPPKNHQHHQYTKPPHHATTPHHYSTLPPYHATPHHTKPRHVTSHYTPSHHTTPYYTTPRHTTPHHATPRHSTPQHHLK